MGYGYPVNKRHIQGGNDFAPGTVRWVENLPAGDGKKKGRPVVIIGTDGDKVSFYICTSQSSGVRKRYAIVDLMSTGLDHDSFIDLEKRELPKGRFGRKLGSLGDYDMEELGL